jgi:hypothetical protein
LIFRAIKCRSNAPITRPDALISSRVLTRVPRARHDRTHRSMPTPTCQVTSRDDPEVLKRDRTRPHAYDRMHTRVRSSFASHYCLCQHTSAVTGCTLLRVRSLSALRLVNRSTARLLSNDDGTHQSRVRSVRHLRPVTDF